MTTLSCLAFAVLATSNALFAFSYVVFLPAGTFAWACNSRSFWSSASVGWPSSLLKRMALWCLVICAASAGLVVLVLLALRLVAVGLAARGGIA